MPTEKELLELYDSADELLHQAQRQINSAETNRRELETILPHVGNQAPILDAIRQSEDTIIDGIHERNALHNRASEIADAIIEQEKTK